MNKLLELLSEKPKILLVDDHPDGLVALEAVLNSPEYLLVTAHSGNEALKALLEHDFALILMDVRMPDLDGFETAQIIKTREKSSDIPIIFITGISKDAPQVYRGYETGAVDYLFKPFDPHILRSKVALFIELFRKNRTICAQADFIRRSERLETQRALSELERNSSERYRQLADAIPHLVWQAKPDGSIEYANRSWHEYTQLALKDCTPQGLEALIHPDDLSGLVQLWIEGMKSKKRFETESRIKRGSDQMYRWHLLWMIPETGKDGEVNLWLGTGTDIHDLKTVEGELRKASEAAGEATRIKSEFLANMSHEIRTPMNSVIGMTGLLLDTPLNDEQRDFVGTIRRSGEDLLVLINDILDFSKVESGKMELEITGFDLRQLAQDCEKNFSFAVQKKGIRFDMELPPDHAMVFRGDCGRLRQVLMNLISNAVKFTMSGSVSLKIQLLSTDEKKAKLRFEVIDTGIGIPESAMSRMFLAFSQADSSTTRRFGGSGLGLSICKRLVELMEGQIGIESREGHGTTFWFTLELEAGLAQEMKPSKMGSTFRTQGRSERILVAEDSPTNQKVVLRVLQKLGYRAEAVANGHEVLSAIREVPYDLILMDWHMPDLDGCEATKIIRTSESIAQKDIPIIAMTANAMKGDQEKCIEVGMNDYISKPINFDLLAEKLQKWLPLKQAS